MSSSEVIRLCSACKTGYILSLDVHVVCEGCLGAEHTHQALTPQASCPSCKLLPAEEMQCRLELFFSVEEQSQPKESYSLDKFLNFLDVRQDLDVSTSEGVTASSRAPSSRTRELEMELPLTCGSQDIQMSTTTLLLVIGAIVMIGAIGALVHPLPEIIQRLAKTCDLSVPGQSVLCLQTSWWEDLPPSTPVTGIQYGLGFW